MRGQKSRNWSAALDLFLRASVGGTAVLLGNLAISACQARWEVALWSLGAAGVDHEVSHPYAVNIWLRVKQLTITNWGY